MQDIDFFQTADKNVRQVWHKNELWFVIEDIIATFSPPDIHNFINNIKSADPCLNKWFISGTCELEITQNGKKKELCTNIEGIFRIVQAINLPEAEPFKLWLAKLGKKRIDELREEKN
jgi:prophage antirepressor-like protein